MTATSPTVRRALLASCLLLFVLAPVLAAGCAVADRYARPDPLADPRGAIAQVFAEAMDTHPSWPLKAEADVLTVTARGILWRPRQDPPPESPPEPLRLAFADITAVGFHSEVQYPGDPEALFVYVRGDPEVVRRAGARFQLPGAEVDVPLARPFFSLRRRPPGSFSRLLQALRALGYSVDRG